MNRLTEFIKAQKLTKMYTTEAEVATLKGNDTAAMRYLVAAVRNLMVSQNLAMSIRYKKRRVK